MLRPVEKIQGRVIALAGTGLGLLAGGVRIDEKPWYFHIALARCGRATQAIG